MQSANKLKYIMRMKIKGENKSVSSGLYIPLQINHVLLLFQHVSGPCYFLYIPIMESNYK